MRSIARLAQIAVISILSGCQIEGSKASGESRLFEQPACRVSNPSIFVGELTRKGSELESWWALRTESEEVYQLRLQVTSMESRFFDLQNQKVSLSGEVVDRYLSFPVICVTEVATLQTQ